MYGWGNRGRPWLAGQPAAVAVSRDDPFTGGLLDELERLESVAVAFASATVGATLGDIVPGSRPPKTLKRRDVQYGV